MTEAYPQKQFLFRQKMDLQAAPPLEGPRVAIITRTKDRPLLLRRALASVLAQTYQNWELVVVNDGGASEDVLAALQPFQVLFKDRLKLIHHEHSVGMEAASNAGIRASSGRYLVIHDDDDSWHPDFLADTVEFLEQEPNRHFGGVISYTTRIVEELTEAGIQMLRRERFNPSLSSVALKEMLICNRFPPISFLFRRDLAEKIGLFNEELPVLGDWEFNIRLMLETDIGIVPKPLAYYHHRETQTGAYGNTIFDGASQHRKYDTLIRNSILRKTISSHPEMLGLLINSGMSADTQVCLQELNWKVSFLFRLTERLVRPLQWIWAKRGGVGRGLRAMRLIS